MKGISVQHFLTALLALVLAFGVINPAFSELSGSLEESQILLRLQPEAELNIDKGGQMVQARTVGLEPQTIADIGQHRYEETCHVCHADGLAGAPKWKDKADWAPRIADGMDLLVKRAIQGYKAMPPKGSCMSCSDEEIKKAVEYMVSNAQ